MTVDMATLLAIEAPREAGAVMATVGTSGLRRFGGYVREEFLPALQGERGMAVFREMADNDPVVGAMLTAIDLELRKVAWTVKPVDDSPQAVEVRDFVDGCLGDMADTWPDTLSSIASMLTFGFSWHEIIYKYRKGDRPGPDPETKLSLPTSAFDDGKLGWANLPTRAQESLLEWAYIGDELVGYVQLDPASGATYVVPLAKSLHFRTTAVKANPLGRSILRNAYRPWYYKRRIEEIEAVGIERDLAGLPMAEVPWEYLAPSATPDQQAVVAQVRKMVTSVRRNEAEGILMPLDYDTKGNPRFRFSLLSAGGQRQFDTDKTIGRYDQRIALTALADFLLIGQEGVSGLGQGGVAVSKTELFQAAIGTWLDMIGAEFNSRAIPTLVRLNGWDPKLAPTLEHGAVNEPTVAELGAFLQQVCAAGAAIFPNPDLENWLLARAGMPTTAAEEL